MCKNDSEMAQFLIENGADANIKYVFGFTALNFCNSRVASILKKPGDKNLQLHLNQDTSAAQTVESAPAKGTIKREITIKRTSVKDYLLKKKDLDAIDTLNETISIILAKPGPKGQVLFWKDKNRQLRIEHNITYLNDPSRGAPNPEPDAMEKIFREMTKAGMSPSVSAEIVFEAIKEENF